MKTFTDLYMELVSHPEFIHGEIIDKEVVIDQVFDIIGDLTNYDMEQHIMDELCEEWFEEHKIDMKRNFNKYFEMGEKYYYLSIDICPWLIKKQILNPETL